MPGTLTISVPDPPPPPEGAVASGFTVEELHLSYPAAHKAPDLEAAVRAWVEQGTERCGLWARAVARDELYGDLDYRSRYLPGPRWWDKWEAGA